MRINKKTILSVALLVLCVCLILCGLTAITVEITVLIKDVINKKLEK